MVNKLFSLNSAYLRVSTCLAVAIREGNCVSLKISGGPWVAVRLLVVSRAPGGRYTPEGFDSGSSSSSVIKKEEITPVKKKTLISDANSSKILWSEG